MKRPVEVLVRRLPHAAELPLPAYATPDASGTDVAAAVKEDIVLKPMERRAVPTGLVVAVPRGYEVQVRPRSGLALHHGVTVANAPGTVDSDYRGELMVILVNLGNESYTVKRGERIAQLVLAPIVHGTFTEREELPPSQRGSGGFGSTGA
jgi:dUTP pyrophosphatase